MIGTIAIVVILALVVVYATLSSRKQR